MELRGKAGRRINVKHCIKNYSDAGLAVTSGDTSPGFAPF